MQNKANLLYTQINVSPVLTKYYENKRLCKSEKKRTQTKPIKPKQTRSEAEIPTGELLGILKPGPNQTQPVVSLSNHTPPILLRITNHEATFSVLLRCGRRRRLHRY